MCGMALRAKIISVILIFGITAFSKVSFSEQELDPMYRLAVMRCLDLYPSYEDKDKMMDCVWQYMSMGGFIEARGGESNKNYPSPYYVHVLHCLNNFPWSEERLSLLECIKSWKTSYNWEDGVIPAGNVEDIFKQDMYRKIVLDCLEQWKHPSQFRRLIDCVYQRL